MVFPESLVAEPAVRQVAEFHHESSPQGFACQLAQHREVSKPHISRKMRAMLKKTGQESINIRELVQNVEAKEPEEVRDESG